MIKKRGGNPNAAKSRNFTSLTRSQQDDAIEASLSPNVLVNNLIHNLSNCGPATLSATNGCQDYEFNKNAVNYLYLQNIRGGKLNKMNQEENNVLMEGGCYTCPKGKRKLFAFSRTFVVIIPSLYNKFKKGNMQNFNKTVKKLTETNDKPKKRKKSSTKLKKGGNSIDFTNVSNLDFSYKEYVAPDLSTAKQYSSFTSPLV